MARLFIPKTIVSGATVRQTEAGYAHPYHARPSEVISLDGANGAVDSYEKFYFGLL